MLEFLQPIAELWRAHPIGQTIGLAASACYLIAATQHHDRRLFGIQLFGAILFIVHYSLLGAWPGAFGYMAGTARNLTAYYQLATPPRRMQISMAFVVIYGAIAAFTAHRWIEIIPPISGLLTALAFFNLTGIRMRAMLMCAQAIFIAYALYVGSIGGVLTASSELILTTLTVLRLLRTPVRIA